MNGHIAKPFNQPDLLAPCAGPSRPSRGPGRRGRPCWITPAFDHAAALMDADDLRDCLDALHARGRSMLRLLRGPSGDDAAWRLAAHTMAGSTGLLGFHDAAAAAGPAGAACDPVAADRPDRALAAAAMARAVDAMLPEIRHLQGDTAP